MPAVSASINATCAKAANLRRQARSCHFTAVASIRTRANNLSPGYCVCVALQEAANPMAGVAVGETVILLTPPLHPY